MRFSDLPKHPCVALAAIRESDEGEDPKSVFEGGDSALLTVRRPKLTRPPAPPFALEGWAVDGWQSITGAARVIETRNRVTREGVTVERFDSNQDRSRAFGKWRKDWADWAEAEKPAVAANVIYELLYTLHARIRREGETVELVLADGILQQRTSDFAIDHPLLLQRVELKFDPSVPAVILEQADRPPELLGRLLTLGRDDQADVSELRADREQNWYPPIAGRRTRKV